MGMGAVVRRAPSPLMEKSADRSQWLQVCRETNLMAKEAEDSSPFCRRSQSRVTWYFINTNQPFQKPALTCQIWSRVFSENSTLRPCVPGAAPPAQRCSERPFPATRLERPHVLCSRGPYRCGSVQELLPSPADLAFAPQAAR